MKFVCGNMTSLGASKVEFQRENKPMKLYEMSHHFIFKPLYL